MKITIDILFQRIAMKPTICKEEKERERNRVKGRWKGEIFDIHW